MTRKNDRKMATRNINAAAGFVILPLLLLSSGCGRSELSPADAVKEESSSPAIPASRSSVSSSPAPAPAIPAPDIPDDAPVLSDVYPALSTGALRFARLTALPDDILIQAEGVMLSNRDLQAEIAQAPAAAHEELRKNAFFLLEQRATMDLLLNLARKRIGDAAKDDDELLQSYFQALTKSVSVTDAEISAFYDENRELVGGAPLEQVKSQIHDHLRRQKEQELIESHVADLGRETAIAVSSEWIKEQAALALDNPVDKARASGIPTFVNFGSKGCVPCDMMEPIREELRTKYAGKVNIVYVNVNDERILASRHGIRGIPHLVFFDKNGKEVHKHTGFMQKEQIEEWLKKSGATLQ